MPSVKESTTRVLGIRNGNFNNLACMFVICTGLISPVHAVN